MLKYKQVYSLIFIIFLLIISLGSCEEENINNLSNKIEFTDLVVFDISYITAKISTKIPENYGVNIDNYGHCWSLESNPDINDNISTFNDYSFNDFITEINGLEENYTYYVRAYFKIGDNVSYSKVDTFKTLKIKIPSISIQEFKGIALDSTEVFCTIESENGGIIISQGICWNNRGLPTIEDEKNSSELGTKFFSAFMKNLVVGTSYYIRAFAINEKGIAYSEELFLEFDWGIIQAQDYDGNWYNTVEIGDQIWLKENLRTTHYPNGDDIIDGTGIDVSGTNPEFYFNYNNREDNVKVYGRLYTWYTSIKVCPDGWHMANKSEWDYLMNQIIQSEGNIKSSGTIEDGTGLWKSPNLGGIDIFGLNIVPTGARFPNQEFVGRDEEVSYLFPNNKTSGYAFYYDAERMGVLGQDNLEHFGFPVRCIKD